MRIISGKARGTRLKSPGEDMPVRPTGDRVKEAMFSAIQFDIKGEVLDLFAGSGQLGLEALSRGATHCVFCDNNPESIMLVRENAKRAHLEADSELLLTDYKRYLKHTCNKKFDVIFIDPPYNKGLSDKALSYLSEGELLADSCIVVLECAADEKKPDEIGVLKLKKRYSYSGVSYIVYSRRSENE
ncbi:MAG: 16S rRNA (guanine(966)-N(2))-methyltransferase RsmD [Clostridiales bacterium]|nr:MAG: 16S rRNA (guanine(966)-N(2))-methyltransferase RsmD [Clostridiales bacterium]